LAYEEKKVRLDMAHRLSLDERERLTVSGVEDVESFDESAIVMYTVKGTLVVRGSGLHIDKLSLDGGELSVEGTIDALMYEAQRRENGGIFSRLFR
jgi:sporulation protein YabP